MQWVTRHNSAAVAGNVSNVYFALVHLVHDIMNQSKQEIILS